MIAEKSLIHLYSGELIHIEHVKVGDFIYSMQGWETTTTKGTVKAISTSIEQECIKLVFHSNKLICSPDCEICMFKSNRQFEWVKAIDLNVSSPVARLVRRYTYEYIVWDTFLYSEDAGKLTTYDLQIDPGNFADPGNFVVERIIVRNSRV